MRCRALSRMNGLQFSVCQLVCLNCEWEARRASIPMLSRYDQEFTLHLKLEYHRLSLT